MSFGHHETKTLSSKDFEDSHSLYCTSSQRQAPYLSTALIDDVLCWRLKAGVACVWRQIKLVIRSDVISERFKGDVHEIHDVLVVEIVNVTQLINVTTLAVHSIG